MEDQRPGGNPAQSRRREGKAHPETRQKHHGAAKAARPETETRGGWGGRARPGPPPKKPRINPRTRLSATWRGGQAEEKRRNACKHYRGRRGAGWDGGGGSRDRRGGGGGGEGAWWGEQAGERNGQAA